MAGMDAESVSAVVTDPPYSIGFMNKAWDGDIAFQPETWRAVWRVMKPGAHLLAFGSTRTHHRMTSAIEDAGFEIRDELMWLHSQGMPKSRASLKPAHEPIVLARKGKGGPLNIATCRGPDGRWPATALHDGRALKYAEWARFFAVLSDDEPWFYCPKASRQERDAGLEAFALQPPRFGDRGGTYKGLSNSARPVRNTHVAVKPVALMAWLCRLITPPGGLVLDPFAGSGSTGVAALKEGFRFVGIEQSPEYVAIARARLAAPQGALL